MCGEVGRRMYASLKVKVIVKIMVCRLLLEPYEHNSVKSWPKYIDSHSINAFDNVVWKMVPSWWVQDIAVTCIKLRKRWGDISWWCCHIAAASCHCRRGELQCRRGELQCRRGELLMPPGWVAMSPRRVLDFAAASCHISPRRVVNGTAASCHIAAASTLVRFSARNEKAARGSDLNRTTSISATLKWIILIWYKDTFILDFYTRT